jgi:hypothetical protein
VLAGEMSGPIGNLEQQRAGAGRLVAVLDQRGGAPDQPAA